MSMIPRFLYFIQTVLKKVFIIHDSFSLNFCTYHSRFKELFRKFDFYFKRNGIKKNILNEVSEIHMIGHSEIGL